MPVKDNAYADERRANFNWLLAWLDRTYDCADGLAGPLSQTGEPYVVISQAGQREEGAPLSPLHLGFSSGICIAEYACRVEEYAGMKFKGLPLKLYWRTKPELSYLPGRGWNIYSRLLITDGQS